MTEEKKSQNEKPLKEVVKQIRRQLPIIILFSAGINILILTAPFYMLSVIDRALNSRSFETLFFLTLIAGTAVLVMGLLETVRGQMLERVGVWFDRFLSPHVVSASVAGVLKDGNRSSQPFTDLAVVKRFISGPGLRAIIDAPWLPLFIVVIWWVHPMLGVIALISAVILFVIALLNEVTTREPQKRYQAEANERMQQAGSVVTNAEAVASMGMLPGFLTNWQKASDRSSASYLVALDRGNLYHGLSKFVRMLAQILVLGGGAYLVMGGNMTTGGMIAVAILLARALAPVEQMIGGWKGIVEAREAWKRLKIRIEDADHYEDSLPLPVPKGQITCEQTTFFQRGREDPVLNGVSFGLQPGESLGIIGPSASGKSTLCQLLVGTWKPTRGHIRLDGADIYRWPRERLGAHVGYLPQEIELFRATVTDNIARLSPNPDAQAVVEAAMLAGVHEMILGLPQGYETEIGDGGAFLSGGQRQRIGLARALYGNPRLIVLDEPNSSLDTVGEQALMVALERVKANGATVIIVAHQPYILRGTDKLLVLLEGRARRFGPTMEVLPELAKLPQNASVNMDGTQGIGQDGRASSLIRQNQTSREGQHA